MDSKPSWHKYRIYLISAVVGMISALGTSYLESSTKEKELSQTQTEQLINALMNDRTYQEDRARLCEETITPLQNRINQLETQVQLLNNVHQGLPVPTWLKDRGGIMLALNDQYEKIFLQPMGKSREDYIGHTDYDIWPEAYANKFYAIDQTVIKTGRVWHGEEWVTVNDTAQQWEIIKYPRYSGNVLIGVGGIAIPPKPDFYYIGQ